jgi:putative MATE family efflux protein
MTDQVDNSTATTSNLLEAPPARALLLFALPTLGSNILQSINSSINAIWVGQYLGDVGLAATANANLVIFLMFSLVFGFGMAAAILIGQSMGRGDIDAVRRAVGGGAGLFILFGIAAAVIGWLASPALLRLLGTPADSFDTALAYLQVMFISLPPGLLAVLLGMALRGTGDANTPLWLMIPGVILNIILNPMLINGMGPWPPLGIVGSATSTVIASVANVILLLGYIYRRDLPIRLRGAEWAYILPSRAVAGFLLGKGVPMGLQMIVMSVSSLAIIGLVNREGTITVAAYGAATQLWIYIQMPAIAIGVAVSAMVAQNIGAGRWDRVSAITRAGIMTNLIMTAALVAALALLDHWILGIFLGANMAAINIATHINVIASGSFILFGVTLVLSSVARANGATLAPLLIMTLALLPGRVGAAIMLEPWLDDDALWWSFPIGSALSLLLTVAYYRHGSWRKIDLLASNEEGCEFVQSEAEPAGRIYPNG